MVNTYFREVSDMADDQDKLAQEWADALIETGDAEGGMDPDDPLGGLEDVGDPSEAGSADLGQDDEALADEWAAALAETEQDELKHEKEQEFLSTQTHDYDLPDMGAEAKSGGSGGKRDLDFILDIPLEVSAELGRTKLLINELLQLGQGSVVELNKLAGEPLEIYVNGKLVARGEAVVINEKFGIRLTDIISPIERVKQLG
ncbi:flagellar motor switch protein FliN [Pseudodesulfovibrio portus]|uniref:Flagellar motor switch protein FliN n=2 Tax=Pseudodesulfovibrio portus TaxID=231439 RepID=A0ABM8ATP2_9BACT|nr:flagellar motor switch protein FliN [Pseudodesulfovibrio portus]